MTELDKVEGRLRSHIQFVTNTPTMQGYSMREGISQSVVNEVTILSAYANYMASKRIEELSKRTEELAKSLAIWNKVYIALTILLAIIALFKP